MTTPQLDIWDDNQLATIRRRKRRLTRVILDAIHNSSKVKPTDNGGTCARCTAYGVYVKYEPEYLVLWPESDKIRPRLAPSSHSQVFLCRRCLGAVRSGVCDIVEW